MKRLLISCLLIMSTTSVSASNFTEATLKKHIGKAEPYMEIYKSASKEYGVPLNILVRMGAIESGFWDKKIVSGKHRSRKGATGIAQFMPATARMLGVNPTDVTSSINGQARYLQILYGIFGNWDNALHAYNWGDGNLKLVLKPGSKKKIPKSVVGYARFINKPLPK